jgi:pimeloyl-ACP methyl ester carboxylesterase
MRTQKSTSFSPDTRFLLGMSQLSLSLAGELSDTIDTVHGEIHRSTLLGLLPSQTRLAPHIYALLKNSFLLPAKLIGVVGHRIPQRDAGVMTLNVQAAVNGVFGDLLLQQNNPLAFNMSMHGDTPSADQPLVLFLHGLCLHEQGWNNPAHLAFSDMLRKQGFSVARLRYNSGLPIAENSRLLADLLESTAASRIVLVGHSMGGLIARSALHQATAADYQWPGQVSHLAALGSPHHGAEAERLGNYANRLLTLSRWSAPLSRIGNLRSAAIHDLRFGSLLHSDRERAADILHTHDPREPIPVPEDVAHLFIAATRTVEKTDKKLRNDLLVTPASALAENYPDTDTVARELLYGIDHLQLMRDEAVYARLSRWMGLC